MGRFFTSTQINNPKQLNCDEFKAYFCEKMKKEGYEVCEADCAELSYVLAFSENCKWVTLSSESYEQGNRTAQADTARIAKMLGTYCVNTIVIDSDCAMLDLYDDKGKKADTLVMGRADDYLGDDIPAPAQAVWEQFVSPDSTWEQFMSVVQGDYVFVEDGLSELAPVIGMDSGNILFEYDDADESNEKLCYLSFKKTASKKEKKPTLNSLFQQIWGAELEPLGFKKPKLRLPYYIRVINDEIIHIVGIHDMKSHLVAFGGIATVYRQELCLDKTYRQNEYWLKDIDVLYHKLHISDKPFHQEIESGFYYHEYIESQPLSKAVQDALNETMTWIVPVLDNIKTLKDVADYEERVFKNYISIISLPLNESLAAPYSDAAIKFILDDPLADLEQRYLTSLKLIDEENIRYNRTQEEILRNRKKYEQRYNESCKNLHMFLEDEEMHSQTLEELARRKKYNLEILKSYGIDSEKPQPKKEKKLTINAAFKQVFGELLEPMGFKLVKSKHPYFVRVVNNEIIHIISYTNTRQKYHNKQPFTIIGGAFSVYRRNFNLDVKPYDNWDSLLDNHKIYSYSICEETYDLNYRKSICNFTCEIDNNDSIISTMKSSLEVTEKIMLTYLNKLDSIESYFKELVINNSFELLTESPEELIFYNIDNFEEITRTALNKKADMYKKCVELNRKGYTNENYENIINNLENYVQEIVAPIKANISESASEYVKESEYNKKKNIEKLKSYGIDFEKPQPKKEKKLTLNAAFKQVFGELLEPMGFKLVKSKHPYFVRVTNDGVVQSVSFAKEKSFSPESEGFSICIGISLISLPLTDYNKSPTTLDNQTCMMPLRDFFHKCSLHLTDFDSKPKKCSVFYKKGNSEEMLDALMKSQRELMPFVLDYFDRYTTLDDIYQHGEEMSFGFYRDVIILKQKVDEHLAEREKKFPEQFQRMVSNAESNPMMRSMLETTKKKAIDSYESINQWFLERKIGGVAYDDYIKTAEKTKEDNLEKLKQLGII